MQLAFKKKHVIANASTHCGVRLLYLLLSQNIIDNTQRYILYLV